jgi:hypothetical protein
MNRAELRERWPEWPIYSDPDENCQCVRKGHPGIVRTATSEQPCLCVCLKDDAAFSRTEFVADVVRAVHRALKPEDTEGGG